MSFKQIGIVLVLIDFAALTVWALVTVPPSAAIEAATSNLWMIQIVIDLSIAATFGGVWLYKDAKARGLNPIPWLVMLPFLGSLALLGYVVRRGFATAPQRSLAAA